MKNFCTGWSTDLAKSNYRYERKGTSTQLTERQKDYVKNRALGMTPHQSALRAGMSEGQAGAAIQRLESAPKIKQALAKEQADFRLVSRIDKQRVVEGFLEAIETAKILSEPSTMVAGWREIGKLCGLYEPEKREIQLPKEAAAFMKRLEVLSDEELLRLAESRVIDGEVQVLQQGD